MKQYADDTTIYHAADSKEELEEVLNKGLQAITRWTVENRLKLNASKSQLLLLGRKGRDKEAEQVIISLNDQPIPRSQSVKCLGIVIDDKLKWGKHIKYMRRKVHLPN